MLGNCSWVLVGFHSGFTRFLVANFFFLGGELKESSLGGWVNHTSWVVRW